MLGADVFVFQPLHMALGGFQHFAETTREVHLRAGTVNFRARIEQFPRRCLQCGSGRAEFLQQWRDDAFALSEQREEKVLGGDFLVRIFADDLLSLLEGFLHFSGKTLWLHTVYTMCIASRRRKRLVTFTAPLSTRAMRDAATRSSRRQQLYQSP